jgi:hypothetical protein
MKRVIINWDVINSVRCEGIATIDEWLEDQTFTDVPFRTTKMPVSAEKNTTGMKNIPAYITEELRDEISSMLRIFFSGVTQNGTSCYKWFNLKTEKNNV